MRGKSKNVIRVPKPPRSAFDKERPASRLLLDQMIHAAGAVAEHLKGLDNRASEHPVTEAHAGDFVSLATSILHPHTALRPSKRKTRTNTKKRKGQRRG